MDYNKYVDKVWIERIRAGDKAALGEVYDTYAPTLIRYAQRYIGPEDAQDAVQESFLRLWRQPWYYQPDKGPLVAWLTRVTRNQCLDTLRKQNKGRQTIQLAQQSYEDELPEIFPQSLAILTSEERQVIIMTYYKDKTQAQIALETGIAIGTIKTRLRSALKKLRNHYEV